MVDGPKAEAEDETSKVHVPEFSHACRSENGDMPGDTQPRSMEAESLATAWHVPLNPQQKTISAAAEEEEEDDGPHGTSDEEEDDVPNSAATM